MWGGLFLFEPLSHSHACKTTQPLPLKEEQADLNRFIKSLAQSTLRERTFHETYYSHMLTTPTHKEGTLVFQPPDRLVKHVQIPTEESFIVTGDNLLYENPSREISLTFSLQEFPALATLIDGLRALFNGDAERLQQVFFVSVSHTTDAWELNLLPKTPNEEDGVDCIRLVGEHAFLRTIEIHETNGDRSILVLDRQTP
ncbi:MAG: outer membrane lipoprotein carrier protein LolA [Nitrospirota bacterium]|nr:outer membrane lipoprotein carrier protein LolA [Nitrospirota bacterium]MDH5773653.1 outer membrane lipoprotein carrier protein LolA [Nitrospirota bacterium]